MVSCHKKKTNDATFLEDVEEHLDEFINASMDEHKTCFKKIISKVVALTLNLAPPHGIFSEQPKQNNSKTLN
jgi:hypothetical protein